MRRRASIALVPLLGTMTIAGCGSTPAVPPPAAGSPPRSSVVVHATGDKFAAPLYQELSNILRPDGVTLNYQLTSSPRLVRGGGSRSVPLLAAIGATGVTRAAGGVPTSVPVGFDAVAVIYHLRGVRSLKLTASTLAEILAGQIARWDARAIARDNPGVGLPKRPILLVHLAGRSPLTELLTRYLSAGSRRWRRRIGTGAKIVWPGGTAVSSESDMVQVVGQTEGTIGYASQPIVLQNDLHTVALRNRAGRFVAPTVAATTQIGVGRSGHRRQTLRTVDASAASAYPIAAELFALTYRNLCGVSATTREGHAVSRVLAYLTAASGQALVARLSFAPLPAGMRTRAAAVVRQLGCGPAS